MQRILSHTLSHFSVTNFWLWRDTHDIAIIKAFVSLAIDFSTTTRLETHILRKETSK